MLERFTDHSIYVNTESEFRNSDDVLWIQIPVGFETSMQNLASPTE
jgi:hypothetical protein